MAADIDSIIDGLMGDIVGKPDGGEIPVDSLQNTIQNILHDYNLSRKLLQSILVKMNKVKPIPKLSPMFRTN